MHPARTRSALLALCFGILAGWTSPARGQDAATLLEEFIHYTNIARTDLASGYAEQLLNVFAAAASNYAAVALLGWEKVLNNVLSSPPSSQNLGLPKCPLTSSTRAPGHLLKTSHW